jgi:hypothetical protein
MAEKETQKESVESIEEIQEEIPTLVPEEDYNKRGAVVNFTPVTPFVTSDDNINKSIEFINAVSQCMDSLEIIASKLIKSKLCPLKTESDVINAAVTGLQLGLPLMVAVNNIYPINGKTTMSTHLHRALLIKHRIKFIKIYDKEPMYYYVIGELVKNDKGIEILVPKKGADGNPIVLGKFTEKDSPKDKLVIKGNTIVDYITQYKFTRPVRDNFGNLFDYEAFGSFTLSEATLAGLTDKDNWKNYLGRMLDARAFIYGAKEIAADITLGIPSLNEIADMEDVKYNISSSLEETIN